MKIPKDVHRYLRSLQSKTMPGEQQIVENSEPKSLVLICSGANGSSQKHLGVCVKYWNDSKSQEETIPVFSGNFPAMLWKWDPLKWAWFACFVIKRGNMKNITCVTFSYKLQKCPNTKAFHDAILPHFRKLWENRFQSICGFGIPGFKFDLAEEEDVAILFDTKLAPSEIEDRRDCPAFIYRYGGPVQGDQYNTDLEVIDSFGKYFPTLKSYLEFRFEKTSLVKLSKAEVKEKVKYYHAKLKVEKRRQANGGIHDEIKANEEYREERLKRMRKLAKKYGEDVPNEAQNACEVCGVRDGEFVDGKRVFNNLCSGCDAVWYCCKEHQKRDWKEKHKKVCKKIRQEKEEFAELNSYFENLMC